MENRPHVNFQPRPKSGFHHDLLALYATLGLRRRAQLAATMALMVVGAGAELATIGAVLPMLALATNPDALNRMPVVASLFASIEARTGWNLIIVAAAILVVATVVSSVLRLYLVWATNKLIYGIGYDLTGLVISRLVYQPYEHHVRQNSSVALTALSKVENIVVGILAPIINGVISLGIAIAIIALLVAIDPIPAIIAASTVGALYIGVSLVARRLLNPISIQMASMWTTRNKVVQEMLGALRDVILDHSHAVFEKRLDGLERELTRAQITGAFLASAPRFLVESVGVILIAVIAAYYSTRPGGVAAAIPILGALALGAQRLLPLLQSVYLGWAGHVMHAQALHDVLEVSNWPVSASRNGVSAQLNYQNHIELRDVSYQYSERASALLNINLVISKGERVGLVGRTGSGKSTLVDILMGLLRPTAGGFLIDGSALSDAEISAWQSQIAHVPQVIFLSDDTIAANIAFGAESGRVDLDRVRDAAARAGLRGFIETLPDGFDTTVGERGIRLSGGQRQRIGIARALYREAKVLFLDEATSALDSETETAIMNSVFSLADDLTVIIIAHRLTTLDRCNVIFRLDQGRIVAADRLPRLAPVKG